MIEGKMLKYLYPSIQGHVSMDCTAPYETEVIIPGTNITSPNYPAEYGNDQDCEITITFTSRIRLLFLAFDLEHSYGCPYDYLRIFDGPSPSSPPLSQEGNLCGSTIPQPISSTGNILHILFHSDSSTAKTGFKIQPQAYDGGKTCNVPIKWVRVNDISKMMHRINNAHLG